MKIAYLDKRVKKMILREDFKLKIDHKSPIFEEEKKKTTRDVPLPNKICAVLIYNHFYMIQKGMHNHNIHMIQFKANRPKMYQFGSDIKCWKFKIETKIISINTRYINVKSVFENM